MLRRRLQALAGQRLTVRLELRDGGWKTLDAEFG